MGVIILMNRVKITNVHLVYYIVFVCILGSGLESTSRILNVYSLPILVTLEAPMRGPVIYIVRDYHDATGTHMGVMITLTSVGSVRAQFLLVLAVANIVLLIVINALFMTIKIMEKDTAMEIANGIVLFYFLGVSIVRISINK